MSVHSDNDRAFQAGVKDIFEKEGITHVVTLTHATVVERFIRTVKYMMHDRVKFNQGSWTALLSKAVDKYNNTVQVFRSMWYMQSFKKKHPERVSHYKSLNDELNWDNVNFPSSGVGINTFEENTGGQVAVNVYFIDPQEGKQSILLCRQSKESKATHQVSLLEF